MPHARVAQIPIDARRAYSLGEVAGLTGFAISTLYSFINEGRLNSRKIAGRRVVLREDLEVFLCGSSSNSEAPSSSAQAPSQPAASSLPEPRNKRGRRLRRGRARSTLGIRT